MSNEIAVMQNELEVQIKLFEFQMRKAEFYAESSMVPTLFRRFVEKKQDRATTLVENRSAVANCKIACDLAHRMGCGELVIFQNLHIIDGRPTWASEFVAGLINSCGKYSANIDVEVTSLGLKTVKYGVTEWSVGNKTTRMVSQEIENLKFLAFTFDHKGVKIEGVPVTIEMAVSEGWYGKAGSKWQTMPEVMGRHRAIAFFARFRIPELLKGMKTKDEVEDFIDVTSDDNGVFCEKIAEKEVPVISVSAEFEILLEIAENSGIREYEIAWKNLPTEKRKAIGAERHKELKEIANKKTKESEVFALITEDIAEEPHWE